LFAFSYASSEQYQSHISYAQRFICKGTLHTIDIH